MLVAILPGTCRPASAARVAVSKTAAWLEPGVEPDVHDVRLFVETRVPPHWAHVVPGGKISAASRVVPGVGALFAEEVRHRLDRSRVVMSGSPHACSKRSGSGTPQARWREMHQSLRSATMLRMRSIAPRRDPLHSFDRRQRLLAKALDRRKPLLGRPEGDRIFAAPAVRVLVVDRLDVKERPVRFHVVDDRLVGLLERQAGVLARLFRQAPLSVDRREERQGRSAGPIS